MRFVKQERLHTEEDWLQTEAHIIRSQPTSHTMKVITIFLIFAACQICLAGGDTNIIAMSDWSKPVATSNGQTLRARMIFAKENTPIYASPWTGTRFYLELQNISDAGRPPMQVYFDPRRSLHTKLLDANGNPPPPVGGGGSVTIGGGAWITLPRDSTIRLPHSMYGYRQDGDTNIYFLSGTFTDASPTNNAARDSETKLAIWSGTLELPKMKIPVDKP